MLTILSRIWFASALLLIVLLSWLIPGRDRLYGYGERAVIAPPSLANIESGQFQNSLEKFLNFHLTSLEYQLILKNTIYAWLNFGQFHSGLQGKIYRGKNGILFEKDYLVETYSKAITGESIRATALANIEQLKILQHNLNRLGISLIVLMAPCKVDFFDFAAPWHFRIREPHFRNGSRITGLIYENFLAKADIPFVNCFTPLDQPGLREISFPDQGTHWSMYGAAICLKELAARLHEIRPSEFPAIEISGKMISGQAGYGERDLANLLNIWPPYTQGRNTYDLAVFKKARQPVPLLIWGDSFIEQLFANMELSGYAESGQSIAMVNMFPQRDEFLAALKKAKAFVIAGNVLKFMSPFWEESMRKLNGYFKQGAAQ